MASTREAILALQDRRYEDATVPEWGGRLVRIAEIDAGQRVEYSKLLTRLPKREEGAAPSDAWLDAIANLKFFLLVNTLVDPETWQPLFRDVSEIKARAQGVIDPLYEVAVVVSTLTEKTVESVKGE